jgi:hypothetical protein
VRTHKREFALDRNEDRALYLTRKQNHTPYTVGVCSFNREQEHGEVR